MNDEMLKLFTEHRRQDGPPLGFSSDDLAAKGRRRLLGRNLGLAGGLSVLVAAAAAVVVALPGAFVSATPQPGGNDKQVEQPLYPLPDLPDPPDGQKYAWGYKAGEKTSAAADEYGVAFQEWFSDEGIDLPAWPGMTVNHRVLFLGAEGQWEPVDDSVPYYGIATRTDRAEEGFEVTTDRVKTGKASYVGLKVYPRGSFEPGAGDTYEHLATCEDGLSLDALGEESVDSRSDAPISLTPSYDCDEGVTTDGDPLLRIEATWSQGDFVARQDDQVIVFREDGSAVMVDEYTFSDDETDDNPQRLSLDELTELAESMPYAIVED